LPSNNNNSIIHTNPNTNITPHTTPPTPPTTQHHNTTSPHNYNITISKTQILNRKHTTPTTQNNIHKIYTLKATDKQIEKYNNTRNNIKSKQQNRKNKHTQIPTFNSKFSLRNCSLAKASAHQPGGSEDPSSGWQGGLEAQKDHFQSTLAISSEANEQYRSSETQINSSHTHKNTKNKNKPNTKNTTQYHK
jgi:hypothetical protein